MCNTGRVRFGARVFQEFAHLDEWVFFRERAFLCRRVFEVCASWPVLSKGLLGTGPRPRAWRRLGVHP